PPRAPPPPAFPVWRLGRPQARLRRRCRRLEPRFPLLRPAPDWGPHHRRAAMDVLLTLILGCSVHLDDNLVEALASKLSISNQYFVGDLSNLETYDSAHSAAEAKKFVDVITARGGKPAVGYLAVPVAWAPRFGRSIDDLFDGCTNIGI